MSSYISDVAGFQKPLEAKRTTIKAGIGDRIAEIERKQYRSGFKGLSDIELFERMVREHLAPRLNLPEDSIQSLLGIAQKVTDLKFRNPAAIWFALQFESLLNTNASADRFNRLFSQSAEYRVDKFDAMRYHRLLTSLKLVPSDNIETILHKKDGDCPEYKFNESKAEGIVGETKFVIDNKEVAVKEYPNDTNDTLAKRALQKLGVLFKYSEVTQAGATTIRKLFSYVTKMSDPFDEVWRNVYNALVLEDKTLRFGLRDIEEIQYLYISMRFPPQKSFDALEKVFQQFSLKPDLFNLTDLFKKNPFRIFYGNYLADLQRQRSEVESTAVAFEILSNPVVPQFLLTPIKQTLYTLEAKFSLDSVDIFELFNRMRMSAEVPFACLSRYVKVLNNFNVKKEWIKTFDELMQSNSEIEKESVMYFYARISYREDSAVFDMSDDAEDSLGDSTSSYVLCSVTQVSTEIVREMQKITYTLQITNRDESREAMLLSNISRALKVENSFSNPTKKFSKGLMILKDYNLVPQIFYDFVMNNPVCSQPLVINEKDSIYKLKGGLKFQLRRNAQAPTELKCAIKNVAVTKMNQIELLSFPSVVEINTVVTTIELTGFTSLSEVEFLRDQFIRALAYMQDNRKEWFQNYYCHLLVSRFGAGDAEFLSTEKKKTIAKEGKELRSKDINPELFVSGYNRNCSRPPYPNEYSEEFEASFREKGVDAMLFPKTAAEGKQYLYTCQIHGDYKFVSLIENKSLSNKAKYPLIPCCNKMEQANKTNSLRYKYEQEEVRSKAKKTAMTQTLKSGKTLKGGQTGMLPKRIEIALNLTDSDAMLGDAEWRRYRPERSEDVLSLMKWVTSNDIETEELYSELEGLVRTQVLAQSGISVEEGLRVVRSMREKKSDAYMDVQSWLPALEYFFQVNIIVMCSDRAENTSGSICPERHQRALIVNPTAASYPETVLLYSHYGGEFEDLERPVTEVIVKQTKRDIQRLFKAQSETAVKLRKLYFETNQIVAKKLSLPAGTKVVAQQPDGYGKIREISVVVGERRFKVYTDPIAPVFTKSGKIARDSLPTAEEVRKWMPKSVPVVFQNKVVAMQNVVSSTIESKMYIPVVSIEVNRKNSGEMMIPLVEKSGETFFKKYNKYNRYANYLNAYALSLYSKTSVVDASGVSEDLFQSIQKFGDKYLKVDLNSQLSTVRLIRAIDESVTEISVPTEAIKQRILYGLEMACKFRREWVENYKYNKYIPGFYTDARDFDTSPDYNVYNSLDELAMMRRGSKPVYKTYVGLISSKTPYFVQPDVESSEVYLSVGIKEKEDIRPDGAEPRRGDALEREPRRGDVKRIAEQFGVSEDEVFVESLKTAKGEEWYAMVKYEV